MSRRLSHLRSSTAGAGLTEYIILLGLLAVLVLAVIVQFGGAVAGAFRDSGDEVGGYLAQALAEDGAQAGGSGSSGSGAGGPTPPAVPDRFSRTFAMVYIDGAITQNHPPSAGEVLAWAMPQQHLGWSAGAWSPSTGPAWNAAWDTNPNPYEVGFVASNFAGFIYAQPQPLFDSNGDIVGYDPSNPMIFEPGTMTCGIADPHNFFEPWLGAVIPAEEFAVDGYTAMTLTNEILPTSPFGVSSRSLYDWSDNLPAQGPGNRWNGIELDPFGPPALAATYDPGTQVIATLTCSRPWLPGDDPLGGRIQPDGSINPLP